VSDTTARSHADRLVYSDSDSTIMIYLPIKEMPEELVSIKEIDNNSSMDVEMQSTLHNPFSQVSSPKRTR
jgi:hypothetical protein